MTTILIVDDHPISRGGIAALIAMESDLAVSGEAGSAAEAIAAMEEQVPDLALIDINLPDRSGLELIKDIHARFPDIALIAISMHDENLYAERVLRAGGMGYITKQLAASEMVGAIRKVLQGDLYVSKEMSETLLRIATNQRSSKGQTDPLRTLTDREFEVFLHIGEGRNTRVIAERLGVSPRTIEAHRTNIKEKLPVEDLTALIRYAVHWVERSS